MTGSKKKSIVIKCCLISILAFLLAFLFPFFENLSFSKNLIDSLRNEQDGFFSALLRSSIFAVGISSVLTLGALLISIMLIKVQLSSKNSWLMNLLLLPIILGTVSSAFVWKLLLLDNIYFFSSAYRTFLALGGMGFWQYGTLFIYLFWLSMQTIKNETWNYANAIQISPLEKVKDIILPHQRNLCILLFVICFVFCFYEEAKIEFIFRASRGTHTELINHWLNRKYQSDALLSPEIAFSRTAQIGFLVLASALVVLTSMLVFNTFFFEKVITSKVFYLNAAIRIKSWFSRSLLYCLALISVAPIIALLVLQAGNMNVNYSSLLYPLSLTFFAALISSILALCFAMFSRLVWKKMLSSFNFRSMLFLVLLFILLIIPPIVVLISGFKWMQIIGYSSSNTITISWIVGHSILSFPLLAGFATATHFRARNNFIDYLQAHSIGMFSVFKDIFLMPFRADYLLTFIIAFSLIWNESIINNVLSDFIPSFVTELNKTISGKAVDYSRGMSYFFISLFLSIGSVLLWSYIVSRSQTNRK